MHRKQLGAKGESLALNYLVSKGYRLLHQNWRYSRLGEIDLVVYSDATGCLSFIEVKTRTSFKFGTVLEAITPRQQTNLFMLAEAYLASQILPNYQSLSFDLVAVTYTSREQMPEITHYPNAFFPA